MSAVILERIARRACQIVGFLIAFSARALAQQEEQQPNATPTTAPGEPAQPTEGQAPAKKDKDKDKEKKKKKGERSAAEKRAIATTDAGTFGVKGRVLTELRLRRAERTIVDSTGMPQDTEVDSFDIVLDSARFSLLYQAPVKWLQAEIETEVADPDQVELKDVYLLAASHGFSLKAGNFKPPTSAIDTESVWNLPVADRGFINALLEDWLAVGGRSPGVQLAYEHREGIEPELVLGTFQGSVLIEQVGADRDLELIEETSLDAQSWFARAQIELAKIDIGVFFAHRVGSPMPMETAHYPVVGADVSFDEEYGLWGVRAWLDAHYGESWYVHEGQPESAGDPWFLAARTVLAGRYGGAVDDQPYSELYVSLGMLDPDLDARSDWAWDFAAGLNFGLWDRARLTLEAYLNDTSRNFPNAYFGGPRGKTMGVTAQGGLAF